MSESNSIDVKHIADLARLAIPAEAMEKLQREMESIVGYVEKLSQLDVSNIEPTAHAVPRINVIREDAAEADKFTREEMLANAPENVEGELIKVPRVLPGEEGGD